MVQRAVRFLALAAAAVSIGACSGDGGVVALHLPEATAVGTAQASIHEEGGSSSSKQVDAAGLLGILEGIGEHWEPTTEPLPPIRFSASLASADNTILLVVWVGDDWLAANDMQKRPNRRQLFVDPDRARLVRALGFE